MAALILNVLVPDKTLADDKASDLKDIVIESDQQTNLDEPSSFVALGNVKVDYIDNDITATANKATYLGGDRLLLMNGNVQLFNQKGAILKSQNLLYLIGKDQLIAEPKANEQVVLDIILESKRPARRTQQIISK